MSLCKLISLAQYLLFKWISIVCRLIIYTAQQAPAPALLHPRVLTWRQLNCSLLIRTWTPTHSLCPDVRSEYHTSCLGGLGIASCQGSHLSVSISIPNSNSNSNTNQTVSMASDTLANNFQRFSPSALNLDHSGHLHICGVNARVYSVEFGSLKLIIHANIGEVLTGVAAWHTVPT